MDKFTNKMVKTNIGMVHISRIINSFIRMGFKTLKRYPFSSYPANRVFFAYLDYIGVSKEDQDAIWLVASNGKSELESMASRFFDEKYRGQEDRFEPKNKDKRIDG